MAIFGIGEGGGEGAIAYHIDTAIPLVAWSPATFLRTEYDCKGRPFGPWRTWKMPGAINAKGDRQDEFSGYGLLGNTPLENEGIMIDGRSIEMMARGCCPPELLAEMLGSDGAAS